MYGMWKVAKLRAKVSYLAFSTHGVHGDVARPFDARTPVETRRGSRNRAQYTYDILLL